MGRLGRPVAVDRRDGSEAGEDDPHVAGGQPRDVQVKLGLETTPVPPVGAVDPGLAGADAAGPQFREEPEPPGRVRIPGRACPGGRAGHEQMTSP